MFTWEEKMHFKPVKCPVCGKKVSALWYHLALFDLPCICKNCSSKLKWHPINRLYGAIFGIVMVSMFLLINSLFDSLAVSIPAAIIPAFLVYYLLPKRVKVIGIKDDDIKPDK